MAVLLLAGELFGFVPVAVVYLVQKRMQTADALFEAAPALVGLGMALFLIDAITRVACLSLLRKGGDRGSGGSTGAPGVADLVGARAAASAAALCILLVYLTMQTGGLGFVAAGFVFISIMVSSYLIGKLRQTPPPVGASTRFTVFPARSALALAYEMTPRVTFLGLLMLLAYAGAVGLITVFGFLIGSLLLYRVGRMCDEVASLIAFHHPPRTRQ